MLIEIRGGGGSGKTTVVRRVMGRYLSCTPVLLESAVIFDTLKLGRMAWYGSKVVPAADLQPGVRAQRLRPIGYRLRHPEGRPELAVIGHYETACGGADTIPQLDLLHELVRREMEGGRDVLVEGLLLGKADPRRTMAHHEAGHHVLVVSLETGLMECLAAMNERRVAAGKEPFTAEDKALGNIRSAIKGCASTARRLADYGVEVARVGREEAFALVAERLGVAKQPDRGTGPAPEEQNSPPQGALF